MMNRSIGLALVAAAASLVASQADASPTFQALIQSGSFSSAIAGTIDGSGTAGSLSISGVNLPNFHVNSLSASFDLVPVVLMDFSGSVTHTSRNTGPIKLTLTLAGLTNPGSSPVAYTDDFDGTFASGAAGNIAKLGVSFGKTAFKTTDGLFASGKINPTDAGPCSLPTSTSYSCSFSDPSVTVNGNWHTYAITQVVTLYFGAKTSGGTATFNNHLVDPIPEPGALGLMLSGLLAAAGFGFRPKRNA